LGYYLKNLGSFGYWIPVTFSLIYLVYSLATVSELKATLSLWFQELGIEIQYYLT
jgi:hypothetical protein